MKYTVIIRYVEDGIVEHSRFIGIEAENADEAERAAREKRPSLPILAVRVKEYSESDLFGFCPEQFLMEREWEEKNAPEQMAIKSYQCARALEGIYDTMRLSRSERKGDVSLIPTLISSLTALLQLILLILWMTGSFG